VVFTLTCLCACSWFGTRSSPQPQDPPEIIVTGAPMSSLVFVDGVQAGQAVAHNDQSRVLDVSAGAHIVEIHVGNTVVYREATSVGPGERRVVTVLSGLSR